MVDLPNTVYRSVRLFPQPYLGDHAVTRSPIRRFFHRSFVIIATWALSCVLAGEAAAERKVFLNGIDLANVDVRGHDFKGCQVRFDDKGDVHITVKGLKIGTTGGSEASTKTAAPTSKPASVPKPVQKTPPASKPISKKYFLVVKPVTTSGDKYQVSVYVNDKLFKVIEGKRQMQVHDISHMVRGGDNDVRLVSQTAAGKSKKGPSNDLEIVLGRGMIKDGTIVIQEPHIQYRRSPSDIEPYDKHHRFVAK